MALDFYFLKLTQPLTVSVREKGEKHERKPYPLPYGLRNPYRNLKSENSQDYAQKPQRNCTFMNLASGQAQVEGPKILQAEGKPRKKVALYLYTVYIYSK